jgi:hypothetical protein
VIHRRRLQDVVLVAQPPGEGGERGGHAGIELAREPGDQEPADAIPRVPQIGVGAIERGGEAARGQIPANIARLTDRGPHECAGGTRISQPARPPPRGV